MVQRIETLLRLYAIGFVLISTCSSVDVEKSPARVLISEDRSVEDGYMVEIEHNGETRQLLLTPMPMEESIWSEAAQSVIITENEDGQLVYERKNIPQDIKNIKLYQDSNVGSYLSVKEGKLNGILDADYAIESDEEGQHFVMKSTKKMFDKLDYVKVLENLPEVPSPVMNGGVYRQTAVFTVEITVFLDSPLAILIGTDSAIYVYLTIFYNSVNSRFKTISSPTIIIKLVGTIISRNSTAEPFITNNINGSCVDGIKELYDFAAWAYKQAGIIPPYDVLMLHIGKDMCDSSGNKNLAGIAFVGTACWKNVGNNSYAVGTGEDGGAYYDGVITITHELAHILGSPHDNDTAAGTGACSKNDGYIMSYVYGVKNHLFFSTCSISKMYTYLNSSSASCVKSNLVATKPPGVYNSTSLPGNVLSMTDQCKKITGKSNATVYTSVTPEDSLCYNLQCIWQEGSTWWLMVTYRTAAEGATCPVSTTKRCINGACV